MTPTAFWQQIVIFTVCLLVGTYLVHDHHPVWAAMAWLGTAGTRVFLVESKQTTGNNSK